MIMCEPARKVFMSKGQDKKKAIKKKKQPKKAE